MTRTRHPVSSVIGMLKPGERARRVAEVWADSAGHEVVVHAHAIDERGNVTALLGEVTVCAPLCPWSHLGPDRIETGTYDPTDGEVFGHVRLAPQGNGDWSRVRENALAVLDNQRVDRLLGDINTVLAGFGTRRGRAAKAEDTVAWHQVAVMFCALPHIAPLTTNPLWVRARAAMDTWAASPARPHEDDLDPAPVRAFLDLALSRSWLLDAPEPMQSLITAVA